MGIRGMLVLLALAAGAQAAALAERVEFQQLTDAVVLFRSYVLIGGARTAANGLLVKDGDSALMVNTAWDDEQTSQVLGRARAVLGVPVRGCVVTHAHDDCSGGIAALAAAGVTVYMRAQTHALLPPPRAALPWVALADGPLPGSPGAVETFYPGPAHAPDNLVVWIPRAGVLFGGCLAKAADATNLGNLADADLAGWPRALDAVGQRYGDARLVVPGHGAPGGPELLTHTLRLLAAQGR